MNREWQYVLHQRAAEFIEQLPALQRRKVRDALRALVANPYADANAEIRPLNDRTYQVRNVNRLQIVYWLNVFVREVCVVRVEPLQP